MKCDIPKERLIEYLYQDLEPGKKATIEAHLAQCPTCNRELEELEKTAEILRTWPDEEPHTNLIFVQERTSFWKLMIPVWLRGIGWRRIMFGASSAVASILLMLSLLNLEVTYNQGNFNLKMSWLPRPGTEVITPGNPLAVPVTQREFAEWQQQSMELLQEMVQASEARQRRELGDALTEFARNMDQQRRQDLRLVGKGLEVFQLSTEGRFRQTDEILQRLLRVNQIQTVTPNTNRRK
ncbi:MAG: zf-HC2 domain-containing protein [bacterium]